VIARNTAFTYKGKFGDLKQIGHELGVRYILEGSVRRMGEQVRVDVQLVDAESGAHVWADRFDTNRTGLSETQDAITSRLARSLNLAGQGCQPPPGAGASGSGLAPIQGCMI